MQFAVFIVLAVFLVVVSVGFYKKSKICSIQKKQMEEFRQASIRMKERLKAQEKNLQVIWNTANTIYLYAAISEEETQSQDLKKTQAEIRKLSEEILRFSDKRNDKN